jgi:hypothetical protein
MRLRLFGLRKRLVAAAATAGLVLAALVGSAAAGQVAPAAASTTYKITNTIPGVGFGPWYLLGQGDGNFVTVSLTDAGSNWEITGRTGKWLELEDAATGECLTVAGSVSTVLGVDEEYCNGRSAELWWLVSGIGTTQIQSQYGTKLLGHDACMWNQEPTASEVLVEDCVSSQPPRQIWSF